MRVLLGIGGAVDSDERIVRTVEQAAGMGDEVVIAIVEHPTADTDPAAVQERVTGVLSAMPERVGIRREDGAGGSRLVEIAEAEGFDAIAIDGGMRSPAGKVTLGPLTEFVVLNATVTVILIR